METNEADAMEAEGAEEEEIMEGEVALQEFQRVEADMGRQLTEEEHEFVDAQLEKNRILAIQSAKRSAEQSTRLKKLKNFIERECSPTVPDGPRRSPRRFFHFIDIYS